jgi:hypothetical protein
MKSISIQKLIVTLVIGLLTSGINAQNTVTQPLPQFLFPDFAKGIVKMKDGRKLAAVLNYNMVDEEMIFEQNKQYMVVDKPEEIDTVYLQNRKFVYIDRAFFEVAASGKVTLFIQHKSRYSEKGTPTAYGMSTKTSANYKYSSVQTGNQVRFLEIPDNITVSPAIVYWANINGEMKKFTSQNQFIKLFPDKEEKIKEFMKVNNIDLKSREGLMNTGNFINSLN